MSQTDYLVQAFAWITLPQDPPPAHTEITIEDHHQVMTEQVERNITPGRTPDSDQHATNAPVSASELNNVVNVIYDPAATHRRCRLEWPRVNQSCFDNLDYYSSNSLTPAVKSFISEVIETEFVKCGGRKNNIPVDMGCINAIVGPRTSGHRPVDQGPLLYALYYRGRQQSAVWDLWVALVDKGFINPQGLRVPVKYKAIPEPVMRVTSLLLCFELPHAEHALLLQNDSPPYEHHNGPFYESIFWLATMIVRGCSDIEALFDAIRASKFLGDLRSDEFDNYLADPGEKSFAVNPREREGELSNINPFGFWLPHGLKRDTLEEALTSVYDDNIMRFNNIEEAYKKFFWSR